MEENKKFSLKALRVNFGWSQKQASKIYGVSEETVKNYESYKTFPDVPIIENILEATKLKYDDIIFLPTGYGKTVKSKVDEYTQSENGGQYERIYIRSYSNYIWNNIIYND